MSKRCDLVKQEQGLPAESGVFSRPEARLWAACLGVLALLLLCGLGRPGAADAARLGRQLEVARDGQNLVLALRLHIPEGFHAYSHEPGDAGRPTVLTLEPAGGPAAPVWYPTGAVQRDYYDPSVTVSVYEGETLLFARVPAAAAGKPYTGALSLLLCSPRQCQPVDETLQGALPADPPPLEAQPWAGQWRRVSAQPPAQATGEETAQEDGAAIPPGAVRAPAPGTTVGLPPGDVLTAPQAALPPPDGFDLSLTPRYLDASLEISGLGKALLFGMLAGLLLNIMPCVLPVLTFKVSGLLLMGGGGKEGLRRFRQHNICFAAGVMTLFSALALVLGLADLMWGQLYQNQAVLMVMLLLVFLMGLSMLGVFTLPVIDLKAGAQSKNPCLQAYASGLVSTFLATPCSGPLLGGVLGWAFTQPLIVVVVVFWSVGLGMALPYVLFSIWPNLARILPKPGMWMRIFERMVGFLLLGTALYLLSILPVERHMQVLSMLLVVALCAWLWGQFCGVDAPPLRRRLVGGLGGLLLATAMVLVLRPVAPLPQWRTFSPEVFSASLGQKPLLLEFTADWCPNCKFMEATVLTDERMRGLQARYGLELVRVDLTRADAYAVCLLEALGSKSIPLTALFPAGAGASRPLVLRDVYGVRALESALQRAFDGS